MKILLLLLGVVLVCGGRLPLPDGRLPLPDGRLPLPDGRLPLPDGRLPLPDGRLPLPDGRLPLPDGRLPLPDGRLPLPDGRLPLPDGRLPLPDGRLPVPDGRLPLPDGRLPLPDGRLPLPDGRLPLLEGHLPLPDSHPPLQDNLTQLSGEWNTLLVAATNVDKISNGPFHGYMRKVDVDITNGTAVFNFSVMMNGLCTGKSAVGNIGRDKFINVGCKYKSSTTKTFVLLGRGLHADDNDFAKFRELMRQNNIPEENLIDMSKTEKCPKNERGTNPS
ncbi:nuclear pore complex-interacting protein family member B13-like [Leopardus geoffroyi]|uniref:nuclear pore complex-interacting protein family member B13-like n=1 Tax=Leopardus geoffroyi TaxID=46844 RepID=UPI001E26623D|nr:nuclear pore complex-interacting protein family member B13-like [Leopardus geoffroyi]